jgi:hypothetical protein
LAIRVAGFVIEFRQPNYLAVNSVISNLKDTVTIAQINLQVSALPAGDEDIMEI